VRSRTRATAVVFFIDEGTLYTRSPRRERAVARRDRRASQPILRPPSDTTTVSALPFVSSSVIPDRADG
jgi:hypothetical protein